MSAFFVNRDYFPILERGLPQPWEVREHEGMDESHVIFSFPAPEGLMHNDCSTDLDHHFFGSQKHRTLVTTRMPEGEDELKRYAEIIMPWPLPNDIYDKLRSAANLIVDIYMEKELAS
jgi:hypothetical protein